MDSGPPKLLSYHQGHTNSWPSILRFVAILGILAACPKLMLDVPELRRSIEDGRKVFAHLPNMRLTERQAVLWIALCALKVCCGTGLLLASAVGVFRISRRLMLAGAWLLLIAYLIHPITPLLIASLEQPLQASQLSRAGLWLIYSIPASVFPLLVLFLLTRPAAREGCGIK